MKYNIYDPQLGDYYEENITLEEAKECAIRFMERSIEEQGEATLENRKADEELLAKITKQTSEDDIAESLLIFDYDLERISDD